MLSLPLTTLDVVVECVELRCFVGETSLLSSSDVCFSGDKRGIGFFMDKSTVLGLEIVLSSTTPGDRLDGRDVVFEGQGRRADNRFS